MPGGTSNRMGLHDLLKAYGISVKDGMQDCTERVELQTVGVSMRVNQAS
jgi:hypothetical protein